MEKIYVNSKEFENIYKSFSKQFNNLTDKPYEFLSIQDEKVEAIKSLLKDLYSWNVREDGTQNNPEILPEIFISDMDEEQIWQQIEIHNNSIWDKFVSDSSKMLSLDSKYFIVNLQPPHLDEDNDRENISLSELEDEQDSDDLCEDVSENKNSNDSSDEVAKIEERPISQNRNQKKSIVDDKFFKLNEMEEFLKAEDEKERIKQKGNDAPEEDVDYFNVELSDEEEENVNYKDFFGGGVEEETGKLKADATNDVITKLDKSYSKNDEEKEPSSNEDDGEYDSNCEEEEIEGNISDGGEPKSSFEMRQGRLRQKIDELEEKMLQEKPWQLKGEIPASGRPQNSLLEEILEFDTTTRPAPVITEETTLRLEDIIRQRIKDKTWDDVERKVKPIKTPQEFRKQIILDQEKSKESLAQIYEKEYRKAVEKLDPDRDEQEEESKEHKEIKNLMKALFNKLDALSNFHYTPKPVAPEPKIITNTPAVNMEEVAPVAVSDAKLLAPEEIKEHAKGDVFGKSERTRTDKNRERRKKKIRQRAIFQAKEERLLEKQKLGLKLSTKEEKSKVLKNVMKSKNIQKIKKSTESAPPKSSKAFFSQLQDKVDTGSKKKRKESLANDISAKKLKL